MPGNRAGALSGRPACMSGQRARHPGPTCHAWSAAARGAPRLANACDRASGARAATGAAAASASAADAASASGSARRGRAAPARALGGPSCSARRRARGRRGRRRRASPGPCARGRWRCCRRCRARGCARRRAGAARAAPERGCGWGLRRQQTRPASRALGSAGDWAARCLVPCAARQHQASSQLGHQRPCPLDPRLPPGQRPRCRAQQRPGRAARCRLRLTRRARRLPRHRPPRRSAPSPREAPQPRAMRAPPLPARAAQRAALGLRRCSRRVAPAD